MARYLTDEEVAEDEMNKASELRSLRARFMGLSAIIANMEALLFSLGVTSDQIDALKKNPPPVDQEG
jgi:hypothetical protein